MGPLALINHTINLLAPAFWLALLLPWCGRWLMKSRRSAISVLAQFACQLVLGCVVLVAGLVLQGRDGKMASYLILVVLMASCQWIMQRGWRA